MINKLLGFINKRQKALFEENQLLKAKLVNHRLCQSELNKVVTLLIRQTDSVLRIAEDATLSEKQLRGQLASMLSVHLNEIKRKKAEVKKILGRPL